MSRNCSLSLMIAAAFAASFLAACAQPQPAAPPDTRAADAAWIRSADADWTKFAAAKDLDKCMSYYADDAVVLASGAPAFVGKDNVRKFIQGMLAVPNMQVVFADQTVDVARSGDIAIDHGTAQVTILDKKGKPVTSASKFVLVWKKQADGAWKIAADTSAELK